MIPIDHANGASLTEEERNAEENKQLPEHANKVIGDVARIIGLERRSKWKGTMVKVEGWGTQNKLLECRVKAQIW